MAVDEVQMVVFAGRVLQNWTAQELWTALAVTGAEEAEAA